MGRPEGLWPGFSMVFQEDETNQLDYLYIQPAYTRLDSVLFERTQLDPHSKRTRPGISIFLKYPCKLNRKAMIYNSSLDTTQYCSKLK